MVLMSMMRLSRLIGMRNITIMTQVAYKGCLHLSFW